MAYSDYITHRTKGTTMNVSVTLTISELVTLVGMVTTEADTSTMHTPAGIKYVASMRDLAAKLAAAPVAVAA